MEKLEPFGASKLILVVGIGGSDLASKAVWNAMTMHKVGVGKKLIFLEAPDLRELEEAGEVLHKETASPEDLAIFVISKSGATEETLTTFHKIFDIASERFGRPVSDRVIAISSPGTPLSKIAEEKGFVKLDWEGEIGGRWSAFTIAHTAVLAVAGLDIERFKDSKIEILEEPKKMAEQIFESYKKGAKILDVFIFNSELEDLGKWVRQLIAESLALITPTVSLGPTDLHSMLELYLEQPGSRFTLFICSKKELSGTINQESYDNITEEYGKRGLPHHKYEMPEINEYELGKFMSLLMGATRRLAELLGVDPYDQPEVENYKQSLHNK